MGKNVFNTRMKVIREHSNFRIGWDLLILILILISCGMIPFQIAFRHAASRLGTEIIYVIDLFFLIDILLNFFTSYRHHGVEITEKHHTARRYLKTVFTVDLVANFPLDIFFLQFDHIQIYSISVILILRVFRLLRIVRLMVIFRRWQDLSYCEIFILNRSDFNRIKNEYPEFREILTKTSNQKAEKISTLIMDGITL